MTEGPDQESASGKQRGTWPLSRDTLADKGVRFGCGALLGMLIVAGAAIYGAGVSLESTLVLGALFVGACGILAITHGERFILGLLKLMRWL